MSQAVLDGVRDLLPTFRSRAEEAERLRVVPEASIKELEETGFFTLLQPKRYGGLEADPVDFYAAVRDIAGACGSTGWVSSVVGVHPWQVALFADEAQQAVWGGDTATRLSSSYAPTGKAVQTDGGFTLSMGDTGRCFGPGQEQNTSELYKLPFHSIFTGTITTPIIGMATGAYDEHVEMQQKRTRAAYLGEKASLDPFSAVRIAKASSEIDAAWALLVNNIREEQDYVAKGEKIPLKTRLKVRRDQVLGSQRAIDAIDSLFEASGGRALAQGTYLQRAWRDAHAGRVHAANDPERALQMYGAHEFGHKVDPGMY